MSLHTVFACKVAEFSQGCLTPGLWNIAKAALFTMTPTIMIPETIVSEAIVDLIWVNTPASIKMAEALKATC